MIPVKQRRFISFAWVAPILLAYSEALAADEWRDLGTLSGGTTSEAWGINVNGSVVIGFSDDATLGGTLSAFRWTTAGGMVSLGRLNGGNLSMAGAINGLGDVIVGTANDGAQANNGRAFRWTQVTGIVSLGTLNGGIKSDANGVNYAGNVVVGMSDDGADNNESRAYRWTQATGMVNLGTFNNGDFSSAQGVNAAGDVVVGYSADGNLAQASRAFRWTEATKLLDDLGTLNGGNASFAFATNAAGNVVVGRSEDGSVGGFDRAFRWTQASGMVSLGTLHGGLYSEALGVDATGNVVVGRSFDGSQGADRAFRWTSAGGMQSIEEWLTAAGVSVVGLSTNTARATNEDGSVVVGTLTNNRAFLARVSEFGSGEINPPDFSQSIARVANAPTMALNNGDLVMDGNPMLSLLPNCKLTAWVNGDIGRNDTARRDSKLALAEMGFGTRLCTGTQFNVALGHVYSDANTGFGGKTTLRSTYLKPEVIQQWSESSLHTTLTGIYSSGDANIHRGYINAGNVVQSRGTTSTETAGARVRLDWLNAFSNGVTTFTPYISLTYLKTRLSAYTEIGGGFPVAWSRRHENATTAHAGLDIVHPLNEKTSLLGRIEAAHRFEREGSEAQGEILGLNPFYVNGQSIQQNWLRFGAGVQSRIADGTGSLMLNVTTRGEVPTYWLNASYRWNF